MLIGGKRRVDGRVGSERGRDLSTTSFSKALTVRGKTYRKNNGLEEAYVDDQARRSTDSKKREELRRQERD
jgi:hypothetical protein